MRASRTDGVLVNELLDLLSSHWIGYAFCRCRKEGSEEIHRVWGGRGMTQERGQRDLGFLSTERDRKKRQVPKAIQQKGVAVSGNVRDGGVGGDEDRMRQNGDNAAETLRINKELRGFGFCNWIPRDSCCASIGRFGRLDPEIYSGLGCCSG